jgi:nitrous oxide reductase accessory protein NosL
MKTILLIVALALLFACQESKDNSESLNKNIAVSSITHEMGCENCGMNLRKFIATNYAVKMNNGDSHFYCSINCSTIGLEELKDEADEVYAIDYNTTKFVNAKTAHYVIGSGLKGTMTQISKFTFENMEDAEEFSKTFKGKEIVGYDRAVEMSKEEIEGRKK